MATILIEKNVMVPMRDGVQLATDVYRLDGEAPAPVLLTRTPYNKEFTLAGTSTFDILRAVQAGYTVVSEPRTTGDGYYESVVRDPDGNLVEITV